MTITAQTGRFAFAEQNYKSTHASYTAPVSGDFYLHKVMNVGAGPQEDTRTFPLEVDGIITPTGGYKAGAFFAGRATINPRLYGSYGRLLKYALGKADAGVYGLLSDDGVTRGLAGASDGMLYLATGAELSLTGLSVALPTQTSTHAAKYVVLKVISSQATALTGTLTVTDGTNPNAFDLTQVTGKGVFYLRDASPTALTGPITTISTSGLGSTVLTSTSIRYSIGFAYSDASPSVMEHSFRMDTADYTSMPWFMSRIVVPGAAANGELGIEGKDCRLQGLSLNFPQNGLVSSRLDIVGRVPRLYSNPLAGAENWDASWNASENYESVPVSCVVEGGIYIPGVTTAELPFMQVAIQWANNLTTPQQEMVIGSYHPDDFTPLSRSMTIQATLKGGAEMLDWYYDIVQNDGASWSPIVFTSPFFAKAVSPNKVSTSQDTQWSLRMYSPNVLWTAPNPPELAGGDIVTMEIQGQVLEPSSGDYSKFTLTNSQTASY